MLIKLIYFLLPAAAANIIPVLVKNNFKILSYPLDLKAKFFDGKRVLGDHKTFRGVIFAVIAAVIAVLIQRELHDNYLFNALSLVNYQEINIWLFGTLIGLGVMLGDSLGSFAKRRLDIKPGKSFYLVDQISNRIRNSCFANICSFMENIHLFNINMDAWTLHNKIFRLFDWNR